MTQSRFHGVFGSLLTTEKASVVSTDDTDAVASDNVFIENDEKKSSKSATTVAVRKSGSEKIGQIAIDMYDEGDYIIIRAPIAGVKLSDLDIDVIGNKLSISGSREQAEEIEDKKEYLQECYWGPFSRSVELPFSPNPSRVKATFNKESILKIYIPKEKKVKIVRINEGG